jgi:hypothetical protein
MKRSQLYLLSVFTIATIAILVVILNTRPAHSAPPNEQAKKLTDGEKEELPKYLVTIYSAGKIVEAFESDKFEFESQPRTTFYGKNGKVIHVLASGGSTTVIRETDPEDLSALRSERDKTKKLQQLLSLKRQEQAIKKEMQDRTKLLDDLKKIEEKGNDSDSISPEEAFSAGDKPKDAPKDKDKADNKK